MNHFTNAKIVRRNAEYSRDDKARGTAGFAMSRSELIEFNRCPSRWAKGFRDDETASTEWGTLIDALVSGQTERIAVCPATYPAKVKGVEVQKAWTRNANYCDEWETAQEASGKTTVKGKEWDRAQKAFERLSGDKDIAMLIGVSEKQVLVSADYWDKATGLTIPIRGMIDLLPSVASSFGKCLADLKTCRNASPSAWPRVVFQHGYHIQGALYLDLYTAATGEDRCEFWHVLQENFAPYETGKRILGQEFIDLGRQSYRAMLKRYCRCLTENHWPKYDEEGRTGDVIVNGWRITSPEAWMLDASIVPIPGTIGAMFEQPAEEEREDILV